MYFHVDILCKISLAKISTFDYLFFTFSPFKFAGGHK